MEFLLFCVFFFFLSLDRSQRRTPFPTFFFPLALRDVDFPFSPPCNQESFLRGYLLFFFPSQLPVSRVLCKSILQGWDPQRDLNRILFLLLVFRVIWARIFLIFPLMFSHQKVSFSLFFFFPPAPFTAYRNRAREDTRV